MVTRVAPLHQIKTMHVFRLKVVGGTGATKIDGIETKIHCTEAQAQALRNIPVEISMKSSYTTFSNTAFDVKITGQDWEKTYYVFLQKLLETPLFNRSSIKWNLVGVNETDS